MKKIILIVSALFISIQAQSQNSVSGINKESTLSRYIKSNYNDEFLKTYCIHFYYDDKLYLLSYDDNVEPSDAKERNINLYVKTNDTWSLGCFNSIFTSLAGNLNHINFNNYPQPISGEALVFKLTNGVVLISSSYSEYVIDRFYSYQYWI